MLYFRRPYISGDDAPCVRMPCKSGCFICWDALEVKMLCKLRWLDSDTSRVLGCPKSVGLPC